MFGLRAHTGWHDRLLSQCSVAIPATEALSAHANCDMDIDEYNDISSKLSPSPPRFWCALYIISSRPAVFVTAMSWHDSSNSVMDFMILYVVAMATAILSTMMTPITVKAILTLMSWIMMQ
jgi:hypothetical protein